MKSEAIEANATAIAELEKKMNTKVDQIEMDTNIQKIEESIKEISDNIKDQKIDLEQFQQETRQDLKEFQKQIIDILK